MKVRRAPKSSLMVSDSACSRGWGSEEPLAPPVLVVFRGWGERLRFLRLELQGASSAPRAAPSSASAPCPPLSGSGTPVLALDPAGTNGVPEMATMDPGFQMGVVGTTPLIYEATVTLLD